LAIGLPPLESEPSPSQLRPSAAFNSFSKRDYKPRWPVAIFVATINLTARIAGNKKKFSMRLFHGNTLGVGCLLLFLLFVSILFRILTRQKNDQELEREAEERLKQAMLARLRNNQSS